MTPELEQEYRGGLEEALNVGWEILSRGGTALDAVEQTVCTLENFHLFNAGRGSVFTHDGKNEMDASIMDGKTLDAGAVAFVRNIKHPITLARLVMERTPHVLLAAGGANEFAKEMGVEFVPDEYFFTKHRWEQLQKAREEGVVQLDHTVTIADRGLRIADSSVNAERGMRNAESPGNAECGTRNAESDGDGGLETQDTGETTADRIPRSALRVPHSDKGTVGAVACDRDGNVAAATSTGGMTNKKFGRVGDTALIGAGTYADNATCAVSCTGHGEFFILGVTAYDVAARMKYKGVGLDEAARETIERLTEIRGEGGFIAVDANGNVVLPFNSDGMYRGSVSADGEMRVEIYR